MELKSYKHIIISVQNRFLYTNIQKIIKKEKKINKNSEIQQKKAQVDKNYSQIHVIDD